MADLRPRILAPIDPPGTSRLPDQPRVNPRCFLTPIASNPALLSSGQGAITSNNQVEQLELEVETDKETRRDGVVELCNVLSALW